MIKYRNDNTISSPNKDSVNNDIIIEEGKKNENESKIKMEEMMIMKEDGSDDNDGVDELMEEDKSEVNDK